MAPSADQVFIRPDYHARYLLPLMSLELSNVFADLSGPIHFINPIEPYDGCIGKRQVEDLNAHYDKKRAEYAEWRLTLSQDLDAALERLEIRPESFGGRPFDQNWAHCSSFPLVTDKEDVVGQSFPDQFHYPLTEDGRRFRYIGYVGAFDWVCTIHLFYDPVEQRALQTFDWT